MSNDYVEVHGDIAQQRSRIAQRRSQLEKPVVGGTAKQRRIAMRRVVRTPEYKSYVKAKRSELSALGSAEESLSEYESQVKQYESEGYEVSKTEEGELQFSKTTQQKIVTKRKSSVPKISQTVVYKVDDEVKRVGTHNIYVQSVISRLKAKYGSRFQFVDIEGGAGEGAWRSKYNVRVVPVTTTKKVSIPTINMEKLKTENPQLAFLLEHTTPDAKLKLQRAITSPMPSKIKDIVFQISAKTAHKSLPSTDKITYAKQYYTFGDEEKTWKEIKGPGWDLQVGKTGEVEVVTPLTSEKQLLKWWGEKQTTMEKQYGYIPAYAGRVSSSILHSAFSPEAWRRLVTEGKSSWQVVQARQEYKLDPQIQSGDWNLLKQTQMTVSSPGFTNIVIPMSLAAGAGYGLTAIGAAGSSATGLTGKVLTGTAKYAPYVFLGTMTTTVGTDIGLTAAKYGWTSEEMIDKTTTYGLQFVSAGAGYKWGSQQSLKPLDTIGEGYTKVKQFSLQKYQPLRKFDIKFQEFKHPSFLKTSYKSGNRMLTIFEKGSAGSLRGMTATFSPKTRPSALYVTFREFLQPDWYKYQMTKDVKVFDLGKAIDAAKPTKYYSPYESMLLKISPKTALKTYPRYGESVQYGDVRPYDSTLFKGHLEPKIIPQGIIKTHTSGFINPKNPDEILYITQSELNPQNFAKVLTRQVSVMHGDSKYQYYVYAGERTSIVGGLKTTVRGMIAGEHVKEFKSDIMLSRMYGRSYPDMKKISGTSISKQFYEGGKKTSIGKIKFFEDVPSGEYSLVFSTGKSGGRRFIDIAKIMKPSTKTDTSFGDIGGFDYNLPPKVINDIIMPGGLQSETGLKIELPSKFDSLLKTSKYKIADAYYTNEVMSSHWYGVSPAGNVPMKLNIQNIVPLSISSSLQNQISNSLTNTIQINTNINRDIQSQHLIPLSLSSITSASASVSMSIQKSLSSSLTKQLQMQQQLQKTQLTQITTVQPIITSVPFTVFTTTSQPATYKQIIEISPPSKVIKPPYRPPPFYFDIPEGKTKRRRKKKKDMDMYGKGYRFRSWKVPTLKQLIGIDNNNKWM